MQLPIQLIASLQSVESFKQEAFIQVHESGEQVTSVRINPLRSFSVDQFPVAATKVPWSTQGYYLSSRPSFTLDPLFHAGAYYVQEASSMFLEEAVRQTVDLTQSIAALDLCAAPGGKSTLLQSIISADSLLVSNEVIQSRVNILKENLIKWGSSNVVVTNNDPKDFGKLEGLFDLLVVDAPCSGSGLFRRDPEAINEWSEANVQLCAQRQQRILADAWSCLKEEGVLIYSTCSYSEEEDEEILNWLMQHFEVEGLQLQTDPQWNIDEVQRSGAYGYRFWPDKVKGEGFFIAAFKKKEAVVSKKLKVKKGFPVSKTEATAADKWLLNDHGKAFVFQGQYVAAIPALWSELIQLLMEQLKVRYAGVELGIVARGELIPEHSLALSNLLSDSVLAVELTAEQAIQYLRKDDLILDTDKKGWAVVMHQGLKLGWVKLLGNRINNYYPKEYRILMSR